MNFQFLSHLLTFIQEYWIAFLIIILAVWVMRYKPSPTYNLNLQDNRGNHNHIEQRVENDNKLMDTGVNASPKLPNSPP